MDSAVDSVNPFDGDTIELRSMVGNGCLLLARKRLPRAPGLEEPSVVGGLTFLDSKSPRAFSRASRSGRVVLGTTAAKILTASKYVPAVSSAAALLIASL